VAAAEADGAEAMTEAERQAALLATAQDALAEQEALSAESQQEVAALNAQVAELRNQIGTLQTLLGVAQDERDAAEVQIQSLGNELNTALARVASEERARAEAEAQRAEAEEELRIAAQAEAARLALEAQDLASYRSEFFGNMRRLVEGREGIEVRGDRFVFSSEVLFPLNSATLSGEGQAQIAQVADLLREVSGEIPPEVNWVIQVDGHTDDTGDPATNWALSQARALSVVRQLSEQEGIPAERLSANGYGEFQPIDGSGTPEGRAQNRRIEIKLTER
jgi:chemotaxis protein MotB